MSDSDSNPTLDALTAEFLRAVDAGSPPEREAFIAAHAEHAAGLRSFFHNQDHLENLADDPDATLAPEDAAPGSPMRVRYFGDYELLEEIARGGMGVVYKARQVSLNRLVALKMILAGQLASPQDVQRFHAEAEAAANLDHPNILPIYEVGEHEGQHYFSMKLVEGGSFSDRLATVRKSVGDRTLLRSVVNQLALVSRAVHFAHQRGILHRDLKPANVLLDADGTPYVTDFGLAKRTEGDSGPTQSGAIVGTPSYMAPEQARSEKQLTTGVDVYALGAMLYEALTGRPPFKAATPMETVLQVLEQEPELPRSFAGKVDRDLETIALKCLDKDPVKRYTSAAELADELERWERGEPIAARPVSSFQRYRKWTKRRPAIATLFGMLAGVVVLSCIALALLTNRSSQALRQTEEQLYVTRVYQASRELADKSYARASRSLLQAPAEHRGWEWHYLDRLCNRERVIVPHVQGGGIATSFDGRQVAFLCGEPQSHVAILDGRTLSPLRNLAWEHGMAYPTCVAMSGDGRTIAAGSIPGSVVVWDNDGKVMQFLPNAGPAACIALSHNGAFLATSGADPIVRIWSTADGNMVHELSGLVGRPRALVFRPGKCELAASSPGGSLVWDVATGTVRFPIGPKIGAQDKPTTQTAIVFSVDGRQVAVADGLFVHFNDAESGEPQAPLTLQFDRDTTILGTHFERIQYMAIHPDGKLLVAAGDNDSEPCLVELPTGKVVSRLIGHPTIIRAIAFAEQGKTILSVNGSGDGYLRAWDVVAPPNPLVFAKHSHNVTALAYSTDGQWLASGGANGEVRITATNSGRTIQRWSPVQQKVARITFSSDGHRLAASFGDFPTWAAEQPSEESVIVVWETTSGRELWRWSLPKSPVNKPAKRITDLAAHPANSFLAMAFGSSIIREVEFSSGVVRREYQAPPDFSTGENGQIKPPPEGNPSDMWSVAYHPDGRSIFATDHHRGLVQSWNTTTGVPVGRFDADQSYCRERLAISADGRTLADIGYYNDVSGTTCQVWDVASRRRRHRIEHVGRAGVALSPDGRRIATVGTTSDLWDAESGERVLSFPVAQAQAVAFNSHGTHIALAAKDEVIIYNATPRPIFPSDEAAPRRGFFRLILEGMLRPHFTSTFGQFWGIVFDLLYSLGVLYFLVWPLVKLAVKLVRYFWLRIYQAIRSGM
jgi:serine/threonine protein kinase/WD40 repeat protein